MRITLKPSNFIIWKTQQHWTDTGFSLQWNLMKSCSSMTIKCLQIQFTLTDLLNEHLCAWNKVTVIKPGMKSADPKQQYYHAKFERPHFQTLSKKNLTLKFLSNLGNVSVKPLENTGKWFLSLIYTTIMQSPTISTFTLPKKCNIQVFNMSRKSMNRLGEHLTLHRSVTFTKIKVFYNQHFNRMSLALQHTHTHKHEWIQQSIQKLQTSVYLRKVRVCSITVKAPNDFFIHVFEGGRAMGPEKERGSAASTSCGKSTRSYCS